MLKGLINWLTGVDEKIEGIATTVGTEKARILEEYNNRRIKRVFLIGSSIGGAVGLLIGRVLW
jgi:hypothetical protein